MSPPHSSTKTLGHTHTSSYMLGYHPDCNAALALLGFLLFLNILRDTIEQLAPIARRKRSLSESPSPFNTFSSPFSASPLEGISPDDPLMMDLHPLLALADTDFSRPLLQGDQLSGILGHGPPLIANTLWHGNSTSLLHQVCSTNSQLARSHGPSGRLFATLASNVIGSSVEGGKLEVEVLEAASAGRRGKRCQELYG